MVSTMDWIEGSKNSETCGLYARKFRCQFSNEMSASLPGQRQPPGLYSILGIIIPGRAKFDVLSCLVTRKDPLDSFIEFLGKRI